LLNDACVLFSGKNLVSGTHATNYTEHVDVIIQCDFKPNQIKFICGQISKKNANIDKQLRAPKYNASRIEKQIKLL